MLPVILEICTSSAILRGGKRIQELHARVFEVGHVPRHHRQPVTMGCGSKLAIDGGESDGALIAASDHLTQT
jgi:hypothetical protein